MSERAAFEYTPYQDEVLEEVRGMKAKGETHQAVAALPPMKVACTRCPMAMWMWVEKTDPARKNAMPGFEDKAGWRCHCRIMNRVTYDEYASGAEPDAWVIGCSGRAAALQKHEADARQKWELDAA